MIEWLEENPVSDTAARYSISHVRSAQATRNQCQNAIGTTAILHDGWSFKRSNGKMWQLTWYHSITASHHDSDTRRCQVEVSFLGEIVFQ